MATVRTLINPQSRTVTSASAKFTLALKTRQLYRITVDCDTWFRFANENDTVAASGAGAILLGAFDHLDIATPDHGGVYLHVIRAAGVDGNANIAEIVDVEV